MATRESKPDEIEITHGTCNVFADLGLPDAEALLAKSQLAVAVKRAIEAKKVTQTQLAKMTGIAQPKISDLMRDRISGFSMDRLVHVLAKLGYEVEIKVTPKATTEVAKPAKIAERKAKYPEPR